jgi:hypothetical protein
MKNLQTTAISGIGVVVFALIFWSALQNYDAWIATSNAPTPIPTPSPLPSAHSEPAAPTVEAPQAVPATAPQSFSNARIVTPGHDLANLRSFPKITSHNIITAIPAGTLVQVRDRRGDFYHVTTQNGYAGWVHEVCIDNAPIAFGKGGFE